MKGAYCLCIAIERKMNVRIGALGTRAFTPGRYVYVGSALNGLEARVHRHLETNLGRFKAIRWHIDYLLKEPGVRVEAVFTLPSDERVECAIADAVSRRGLPIRGFGCSDCRCGSHLFKVDDWRLNDNGMECRPTSDFVRSED